MKNYVPETKYIDVAKYPPPMGGKPSARAEIASRIAALRCSNEDAVAVPGLEESGVEVKPAYNLHELVSGIKEDNIHAELPPSEWSPTIGQPEAANSDNCSCTPRGRPDCAYVRGGYCSPTAAWGGNYGDFTPVTVAAGTVSIQPSNDNYTTLRTILDAAFAHAAIGKGKERHARDLPFDKQPMLETTRLVGPGFPLGQAIKKAGEAAGMIERGQYDAAEAECLGAINYLAGAVAWMRERAAMRGREAA